MSNVNDSGIKPLSVGSSFLIGKAISRQMQVGNLKALPYYLIYEILKDTSRVPKELTDMGALDAVVEYCGLIEKIEEDNRWGEVDLSLSLGIQQATIFKHASQYAHSMRNAVIEPLDLMYGACASIFDANGANITHEVEAAILPLYQVLRWKLEEKVMPNGGIKALVTTIRRDATKAERQIKALKDNMVPDEDHRELSKYADLMNGKSFPPFFGRSDEIRHVQKILLQTRKNNPILLGEAGVGKTAIIEGLVKVIEEDDMRYPFGAKPQVYSLDVGRLVAGTMFRGDFEKRVEDLLSVARRNKGKVILFIDEFHKIIGAGGSQLDAANLLKPALARGEITIIGGTTLDEYRKYIAKDKAMVRRFANVLVEEPDRPQTLQIMNHWKAPLQSAHRVSYEPGALVAAYELGKRYFPDRAMPDIALDLLDAAGADASFHYESGRVIDGKMIAEAVSEKTGVPVAMATPAEHAAKSLGLESRVNSRVFGQERAAKVLGKAVKSATAGLREEGKTKGAFLFDGPTGTGKTEVAKVLAESLGVDLIRIDMSEYMDKHSLGRLIGAPPGYVGYDQGGQLTEKVNKKPYSVVLLDEAEKAAPEIFNVFLQILDNGFVTDGQGRQVDFRNTVIIMTTNAGQKVEKKGASIGFTASKPEEDKNAGVNQFFTPEFRNRLDAVIQFESLSKEVIPLVVRKFLDKKAETLMENRGITLEFTQAAADQVAKDGFDPVMNARPLARYINEHIDDILTEPILMGKVKQGDILLIDFAAAAEAEDGDGKFTYSKVLRPANDARGGSSFLPVLAQSN